MKRNHKPTTPNWLEEAKKYAFETWKERFGEPPGWPVKDYVTLSTFLALKKGYISLEDFKARWDRFLTIDKKFYIDNGYGLAFFCSQFNSFIGVRALKKRQTEEEIEREWYKTILANPDSLTEKRKVFKAQYEKEHGIKVQERTG